MQRFFAQGKIFDGEMPPTAGLPLKISDFFGQQQKLTLRIAALFDLPPLLLECSGTAALVIALETLKRLNRQNEPDNLRHEVIIPAFNCPLVVLALSHCGLKPIICDTAENSFDFHEPQLQALANHKTLAIIPTHIGGQIANVAISLSIARQVGAYIIEDCAQALGAQVGQTGDIAFFSLALGKGLTLFEGGLLTARQSTLFAQLQQTHAQLVKPARWQDTIKLAQLWGYYCCYHPLALTVFYGSARRKFLKKHDYIQAVGDYFDQKIPIFAVGAKRQYIASKAAERLPQFLQQTKQQALKRIAILQNNPLLQKKGLHIIKSDTASQCTWPFLMLQFPTTAACDKAMAKLWPSKLGVTKLFVNALPDYDYLKPLLNSENQTPNATQLAKRMITISNSLWLDDQRFMTIVKHLEHSFT